MQKLFAMLAMIFLSVLSGIAADPPMKITVESDPKSHLVRVNEPFAFIIRADKPQKLNVVLSLDGEAVLKELTVTTPARIPSVLPFPGFVRCTVTPAEGKAKPVSCAVGVDPDQLRPLLPEPPDFDAFWERTKKELAAIPPDFKMEKIGSNGTFNNYRISCANLNGQRAYAFLALPADPSRKMPLLVTLPGWEALTCEEDFGALKSSVTGFESARLLFHLPPYQPVKKHSEIKARHDRFLKEIGLRRYVFYKQNDRDRFYARTGITGCIRLLEEALKQPGLDPKRVWYYGASHGGGFGLYLAAFSDKLTAAFCGVPNFGDRGGFLAGHHIPDSNSPEYRNREVLKNLLYFDASYAARRIQIPIMIGVGFTDVHCPPSAVYTIYNELRGPKIIFNKIRNGHGDAPPEYTPMAYLWLSKQVSDK